jgi:hypothetical protein
MGKKLPSLYVNKIEKNINNNVMSYYSGHNKNNNKKVTNTEKKGSTVSNINIKNKISEMFASPNYVYKMNVAITLKNDEVVNKSIIGQVEDKLLAIDEELINIKDIKDIKF